jgi:hypothetical protein
MKVILQMALICAALSATPVSRADVTLESLLHEMTDYAAVARWPQPEFICKQASSYDRGTVAPEKPGWFANSDQNQFIRVEANRGRTEKVMLDADGPGCIVRFWLTTDRNKKGTMRFYLDGAAEPALAFPAYDLLSGDLKIGPPLAQPHPGYRPDANGGNNFYLPIPYAKHCKITWEEAGQSSRYYQINFRTYVPGTAVQTFTRPALEAARPAVERVNKALQSPPNEPQGQAVTAEKEIAARGEHALELPPGPSAVRRLELRVPAGPQAPSERALRSLISTTRHISQDGVSLLDERWDAAMRILSGRSAVVSGDPYTMTLHLPQGFKLQSVEASGQKVEIASQTETATVRIVPTTTKAVE